jgi:hypothetical protein
MELQDFEGKIHTTRYNGNRLKLYSTWGQVAAKKGGASWIKRWIKRELNFSKLKTKTW